MVTNNFKALSALLKTFAPVDISQAATLDKGISTLENITADLPLDLTFFIPASGAGSRLFGGLSQLIFSKHDLNHADVTLFFDHLNEFAFYPKLLEIPKIKPLLSKGHELTDDDKKAIFYEILYNEKLNFESIPKLLLPVHRYPHSVHDCLQDNVNFIHQEFPNAKFHFTIDRRFEMQIKPRLSEIDADISLSIQSTILKSPTLDHHLNYILDEHGNIITRPGGHGTLLDNLNTVDSSYIVLKNIDNIPHASSKNYQFIKQLVSTLQRNVKRRDALYHTFESDLTSSLFVQKFLEESCGLITQSEDKNYLLHLLNRPMRICGMVPAKGGQVGGGPYWVNDQSNRSLQIIEEVELPTNSSNIEGTHFNPVWIACYTKDVHGNPYDLTQFAKKERVLPISKILNGREIQSVEYPGLWNGQMHDWNTQFAEVPLESYTPIKSILDLLKREHKPS